MTRASGSKCRPWLQGALLLLFFFRSAAAQVITFDPNLADEQVQKWYRVAFDDAGLSGRQPHLTTGSDYRFPEQDIPLEIARIGHPVRTAAYGREVKYAWAGLRPEARYRLRLTFLADVPRTQRIKLDGRIMVAELRLLPSRIVYAVIDLPFPQTDGICDLVITSLQGPNAVVSILELYSNYTSLRPDPVFEAYGDCRGTIQGSLYDRNRNEPYAGQEIRFSPAKSRLALSTRTDENGLFRIEVPRSWESSGRGYVRVETTLPDDSLMRPVSFRAIFSPRLTPRPVRSGPLTQTSIDLNGPWRFHPSPPEDFPRLDASGTFDWDIIEVPGEWAMQGFSVPPDTAAAYWREFSLPEEWKNLRSLLRCDAVYSDAVVYINGQRAGDHQGGFTAFELDVSDLVRAGRNTIALAVKNESLEDILASGSQYAAHPLGGITRKMTLWAVPACHVSQWHTSTRLDDAFRDAYLDLEIEVSNTSEREIHHAVLSLSLLDSLGYPVASEPTRINLPVLPPRTTKKGRTSIFVPSPLKWDCEHPHLYTVQCVLEHDGRIRETLRRRIGFRKLEVRGDQLLVNGRPIKLRGINRHEVHPLRGRSLTPELWKQDARLFRNANLNYVRTSHYPPAEEFLDACDEIGLFVECEAPLCWVQHGANATWELSGWDYRDRKFFSPLLLANLESIELNRDHPSVLIWSLANESRWSPLFAQVMEMVKSIDPTRPVSFHDQCWGEYNNGGSQADIANYHYPGPDGPGRAGEIARPLLFGEFCHLNAYNRYELETDPGLRDAWGPPFQAMWEKMYRTKGILGGAIWSGIDDTFHMPAGLTLGYGAWGPLDGWRREKPEYWHIKKTFSPVKLLISNVRSDQDDPHHEIELENRHDFTNINELEIIWSLSDGRTGRVTADIPPRSRGRIQIPIGNGARDGQMLTLQFLSPRGFLIDSFRLPLGRRSLIPSASPAGAALGPLALEARPDAITVTGGDSVLEIDPRTGKVRNWEILGRPVLTGGPDLMLLPLNREGGTQMTPESQRFAPYTAACSGWESRSVRADNSEEGIRIRVEGSYRQAEGAYTLHLHEDGGIEIAYRFFCREEINPRQIGLVFTLPKEYDLLSWNRHGLWTLYPEDHIGRLNGQTRTTAGSLVSGPAGPRTKPPRAWAEDANILGSHDFRSTKSHIFWSALTDRAGSGISVRSDGSQHVRCWAEGNSIKLLVADYSNMGAERFLASHARNGYRPLKPGAEVQGVIRLYVLPGKL